MNLKLNSLNAISTEMAKHTQTIRRQQPMNCLGVFDQFVELVLNGLSLCHREISHIISSAYQLTGLNIDEVSGFPNLNGNNPFKLGKPET